MRAALSLASRGLGRVWPNPAVGSVVTDRQGRVVGRGWTQPGGRPHAETEALARAGDAAEGGTVYVSLEPCAHHGQTPPCADALIEAGVARVVAATEDPDPRVAGAGLQRLRDAGLAVECGVMREEAEAVNAGYMLRHREGRPLVSLKVATTLDGRIATHSGHSQWITGEAARAQAHMMRARYDAIMVGIGTALADNPLLTCRLPGLEDRSPVRIVVDARLHLPLTSNLVATAKSYPTWLIAVPGNDEDRLRAFEDCGVHVIEVEEATDGYPDPSAMFRSLADAGLTRVLVEGGGHLSAALIRADMVDRLRWFRSAGVMGGDGLPVVAAYGVDELSMMRRFRRVGLRNAGDDILECYIRHG